MEGRGASGRTAVEARPSPAGSVPPWWPDPPGSSAAGPDPALPWLTADATPARGAVRSARRRPVRRSARRLVVLAVAVVVAVVALTVGVRASDNSRTPTLTTPFLSYAPPAGWSAPPLDRGAGTDAPALTGVVHGPGYECGGQSFVRGFAAAALLPTGAEVGPAELAERLARWFAATSYAAPGGAAPDVSVAPPRPVPVDGPGGTVAGTVVEVSVRAPAGPAGCSAGGTVLALGAPVSGGAALLLVAGDSAGGPTEPAAPDRSTLDAVLASVRLGPP